MTELKENQKSTEIVQDSQTKELLSRSLRYMNAGYCIHFTGPTGVGKTALALALAKRRSRPIMVIHGNHELNNRDLLGDFSGFTSKKLVDNYVRSVYKKEENVTETWQDGRLLEAAKKGYTLIYDEFTRSNPETNNLFLSILEEGVIPLYGTKKLAPFERVHPEFSVIFTSNPEEYAGVYRTQDALLDRVITISVDYKTPAKEAVILSGKLGIKKQDAKVVTSLLAELRKSCPDRHSLSLRSAVMIAQIARDEKIPMKGTNEEFQQLCLDVLQHKLGLCLKDTHDNPQEEAKNQIINVCKKL